MARDGFFSVDSLTSVHVVVVDGDASFRTMLVSILRYCGALVTAAGTAEDAISTMDQIKPDVVVITLGSPEGAALPGRIRARKPEGGGNVPIVAVLPAGAEDGMAEGCNVTLHEPLNPWELCREISSLVSTG